MTQLQASEPEIYQGQFGSFTITEADRSGVIIYRTALNIAALCFAIGSTLVLWQGGTPAVINALTPLYGVFCLALGISLLTIHIYLAVLHRALQLFWAIGVLAAIGYILFFREPLALTVYNHPTTLFGIGFTFAALTGIYFKEAFCFSRLETKLLTPLVPILLLGHLTGILPVIAERVLLATWAVGFVVFALRKALQAIPPDIGDKSVFAYLKQQRQAVG
ncbi:MAG: DUF2301 domain-containing membrane protein [Hormoscilla sp. GM102CHS1]|nr:DUF2301 domain-containing membrane protein [Hormoscilla sp. GM102CHS1]